MSGLESTFRELDRATPAAARESPGVLRVWGPQGPCWERFPAPPGEPRVIGRCLGLVDHKLSRRHCELEFDGELWHMRDLDSKNGSFVDGRQLRGAGSFAAPRVLRVGDSLFVPALDLDQLVAPPVVRDGLVLGPRLQAVWTRLTALARLGDGVFITGESGTGKEQAARAFHAAGKRAGGPFVAVNGATIPAGLAERLLFGARRGAYSGATESATGLVQAADGGLLFLDEVAELELAVQAKLLRVLETHELTALGDTRPRHVDFALCAATHRDLRAQVGAGTFREDLYFRIARPDLRLPPLRERAEDIPTLLVAALAAVERTLAPRGELVETCLIRPWPGNVRELLAELRLAGQQALLAGREEVTLADLDPRAGLPLRDDPTRSPTPPSRTNPAATRQAAARDAELRERWPEIEAAIRSADGNLTRAAAQLGVHRTQLRRWLDRLQPKQ